MDAWSLGANIGTLYAFDSANDMAERDTLGLNPQATGGGRVNVSGRLSYQFDSALEPYVSALLEYDYLDDAGTYDDRVGLVLGLGLNIFTGTNFTANVESSTSQLRADSEDYSLNARIRLEF